MRALTWCFPLSRVFPLIWVTCGCTDSGSDGVVVVGSSSKDFGSVLTDGTPLRHTFVLRNDTPGDVRVANVRKTCGCTRVDISPRLIAKGARAKVDVELDTRLWGRKSALVLLELEGSVTPEIALKVRAFIEREYKVLIHPRRWSLPQDVTGVVRRTFSVREITSQELEEGRPTVVSSESDELAVVAIGPWTAAGRVIEGFARESEVTLEYRRGMDESTHDTDRIVNLTFRHSGNSGDSAALEAEVPLLIRGF